MLKIEIGLPPRTKKNSQRLVNVKGRVIPIPSKDYVAFEKASAVFIRKPKEPIKGPVNVKCLYFMPTRRRVDLVNLEEATLDILVKYGVLEDDNCNVVESMDGSRVLYDKERPRTEIEITESEEQI